MITLYFTWLYTADRDSYYVLKDAAYRRHQIWNILYENGDGNIDNTWHANLIDCIYPK